MCPRCCGAPVPGPRRNGSNRDGMMSRGMGSPSLLTVITHPPVRHDLAFSIPEEVTAGEVVAVAREAAGSELREMRAFDVYRGEQVEPGRKSVAFSLTFQSPERTLSDEDAARLREAIVSALTARLDARLRA